MYPDQIRESPTESDFIQYPGPNQSDHQIQRLPWKKSSFKNISLTFQIVVGNKSVSSFVEFIECFMDDTFASFTHRWSKSDEKFIKVQHFATVFVECVEYFLYLKHMREGNSFN